MYIKINKSKELKNKKKLKTGEKIQNFCYNIFKTKFNKKEYLDYKNFFLIDLKSENKINYNVDNIFFDTTKIRKVITINFVDTNNLISIDQGFATSSNDIVQGIPKLNSLLEADYKSTNKRFRINSFFIKHKDRNLSIGATHIYLKDNYEKNTLLIKNKTKLRENKDPENFLWYLISTQSSKINIEKNILNNIIKTKTYIANSLQKVYKEQNIVIARKTFESIINTMFSRIIIINTLCNPFLHNEKLNLNLYLKLLRTSKLCKTIPPVVLPFVDGISKSVYESNKTLSVISFRDAITNITKKCLYGSKDWLNSVKAKLLAGQQLKMGTKIIGKSLQYYVINDFLNKKKDYN